MRHRHPDHPDPFGRTLEADHSVRGSLGGFVRKVLQRHPDRPDPFGRTLEADHFVRGGLGGFVHKVLQRHPDRPDPFGRTLAADHFVRGDLGGSVRRAGHRDRLSHGFQRFRDGHALVANYVGRVKQDHHQPQGVARVRHDHVQTAVRLDRGPQHRGGDFPSSLPVRLS